jgi:hypothetical protein
MRRILSFSAIWVLSFLLVTLAACGTQPGITSAPYSAAVLDTPAFDSTETSVQATLAAALTQEMNTANDQAVATAEIVRANAQATLSSANATLSAAQVQDQNNANLLAAQLAATAAVERANAQATLVSASSTQSAAQTQDAFQQTQVQDQQNKDNLAAATQTAVANLIATQTQSAVATSQWYTDQSRQRDEKIQNSVALLFMWCLAILVVLIVGLGTWILWRWVRGGQNLQPIIVEPVKKLQSPVDPVNPQERFIPPGSDIIDGSPAHTQADRQMRGWMDEIKGKLSTGGKDNDDNPDD